MSSPGANDAKKEASGHGWLIGLSVVFALYLFLPWVFGTPLELLNRTVSGRLTRFNRALFFPLEVLSSKCQPYGDLINFEAEVLGRLLPKSSPL